MEIFLICLGTVGPLLTWCVCRYIDHRRFNPPEHPQDALHMPGTCTREPSQDEREVWWMGKGGSGRRALEMVYGEPLACVRCKQQRLQCECIPEHKRMKVRQFLFSPFENCSGQPVSAHKDEKVHPLSQAERRRLQARHARNAKRLP